MSNYDPDSNGHHSAEALLSHSLLLRLDQLKKKYTLSGVSYPCYCELFLHIRRILDLAHLYNVTDTHKFESALDESLKQYSLNNNLQPALYLLHDLSAIKINPPNQPLTSPNSSDYIRQKIDNSRDYHIHLVIPYNIDTYHDLHINANYKLSLYDNPTGVLDNLRTKDTHIIILDENLCIENRINIFEYISCISQNNCRFVIFSTKINFNKRLSAARCGASLVRLTTYNNDLLTEQIKKIIDTDKTHNKRLLFVSNDLILTQYISKELLLNDIEIDCVTSGSEELLNQIYNSAYDLILTDHFLENMTGIELTRIIRQDDRLRHIPIVYLSHNINLKCTTHSDIHMSECHIIRKYEHYSFIENIINLINNYGNNYKFFELSTKMERAFTDYRRAIDSHSIISITDKQGIIIDVNLKFIEISGYEREELIGRPHNIINSGTHPKHFFTEMWRTISSGKTWQGEICNRRKNGTLYWVEATIVPCLDANGKPYQYVSARTEITRLKQIEQKLRTSESRLKRSQSFANIGTWDWDIKNNILYWSESTPPLFGYAPGEIYVSHDNFLESIHPDDRNNVINSIDNTLNNNAEYKIEYRCIWPDSTVHWMLEKGDVYRNPDNQPLHMLGVVMDITDQKVIEHSNIQQKKLLDILRTGLSWFVENQDISHIANYMLQNLIQLTNSKFGIIGGVVYNSLNKPYLKTHSITNIAWDEKSIDFYKHYYKSGLEFHNLDNLIGEVIKHGKPVISNNPASDARSGGLPKGHPELTSYLGIPVFHGEKLVAMYCLANRLNGYNEDIITFLKPFNVAYSSIMHGSEITRKQNETLIELENSRNQAIEANKAKSQFLSNMSHELRTPLNAILGFSQLLEINYEKNLTPSQLDNINEVSKSGKHLLQLINQILDLSKLESGKIDLHIEPVSVSTVVSDCLEIIKPLAANKNITINCNNIYCVNIVVNADRLRLKQILLNFLSNSIKYNKIDGSISIEWSILNPDIARISVSDTGKGIPEDKQSRLFKAFDRLDEKDFESEGTGIGLIISKNLAELMHGIIGFRNNEHEGSEFWIDIPRSLECDNYNDALQISKNTTKAIENNTHSINRIIYVEDNPTNLRLVESIFNNIQNIDLISAQDSYLGYQLINLHIPDLVLLDINMPGINGYELLKYIRSEPKIRHIPVIAISANATPTDIEKGIQAGFDDYITKPIIISQLLDVIHKHLDRKKYLYQPGSKC